MTYANIYNRVEDKLSEIKNLLSPYTKRAYLVGGCVRDLLLGLNNSDFDIEVYDIEPAMFDGIMTDAGADGVGKSYFVYKLREFDLSLPRTESKTGIGHKAFDVSYCNDEFTASLRRDFTMNAMMMNIFTGEVLDYHQGLQDLHSGVVRHVNDEKFAEDSLRVLRAVRFASKLGFTIAAPTLDFMRELPLSDISADRIGTELIKLFNTKHQDIGAQYMFSLGLFDKLFGLSLAKEQVDAFAEAVVEAYCVTNDYRQFIYLLRGMFGLEADIVEKLRLPNEFKSCFRQDYEPAPSDYFILKTSFRMPIKKWLGANKPEIVNRAKQFGVYDEVIKEKIDANEIVAQGFKGPDVGAQISRIQDEIIEKILHSRVL